MGFAKILTIVIATALIMYMGFFIARVGFPENAFSIITTTTKITTTTTTLPTVETMAWLEWRVHELVNEERMAHGLQNLTWDNAIVNVARGHSEDMAEHGYFSHTSLDGSNLTTRLYAGDVYYWSRNAENILMMSRVDYYVVNIFGKIVNTKYKTWEQLANDTVAGWMNSTGHRENILVANFTHAGVGIAEDGNNSYYFTQNFITRIECGYKDGECCKTEGYLPWCYKPWDCVGGFCV